jgi:pimeloyl-ACP methyl ester carboxylesterase
MADRKKRVPRITLKNARPPYDEEDGDYVYFADADGQPCADRHPFRPDARGFQLVNAWWLIDAATLAYSDRARVERRFREKTPLRQVRPFAAGGGTECFVAFNEEFAIVAFRGTEISRRPEPHPDFRNILHDVGTDADIRTSAFGEGANVHRGFAEALDGVWEAGGLREFLSNLPSRTVWFTGHSLGAALATLAAARTLAAGGRLDGLYTYGSPRVGDEGFAAAFDRLMAGRGIEHYRFVNHEDLVTKVPITAVPARTVFKHVGSLRRIDREGHIHDEPAASAPPKHSLLDLLPVRGGRIDPNFFNLIPGAVDDHVPTLYSTHIWNALV